MKKPNFIRVLILSTFIVGIVLILSSCYCEHEEEDHRILYQPTCTHLGTEVFTCKKCGNQRYIDIPMIDHEMTNKTVTKEASCIETGILTITCKNCDYSETEKIPLVDHKWKDGTIIKKATIMTCGTREVICSVCNCKQQKDIDKINLSSFNINGKSLQDAEAVLKNLGISSNVVYEYGDITCCCFESYYKGEYVNKYEITGDYSVDLITCIPSVFISYHNIKINSVGGVDVHLSFKNKSNKDIAYIVTTLKFYDRVGYPAKCEIKNKDSMNLTATGPFYSNSETQKLYWDAVIYNSTISAYKPIKIEITFLDGTKQTITCDGAYGYANDFYGGELHG